MTMTHTQRGRGIAFALLSAICFSTLGIFAELLYQYGFSVAQTLAWRFTFSVAILSLFLLYRRIARTRKAPRVLTAPFIPRDKIIPVVLLGFLGFAPQAGLYFLTIKLLDPGITSMLLYLYPSFVLIFSLVFFKRKPSTGQLVALLLSLVGCMLTFFRTGDYPFFGLLLGVIVALSYGGYLLASEKILVGVDPIAATTIIMGCAAIVYWAWALADGRPVHLPAALTAWAGIFGLALIATLLPIVTLFKAIHCIGASDASLASTIEPVSTVLLSMLILGEKLTGLQAAGGILILAAVFVLRFANDKKYSGDGQQGF